MCKLDGADGVGDGAAPFPGTPAGQGKEFRVPIGNADRNRAVIVNTSHIDVAGAHGIQNAGHQFHPQVVPQLNGGKSQTRNFGNQGGAVMVTERIPSCRECELKGHPATISKKLTPHKATAYPEANSSG